MKALSQTNVGHPSQQRGSHGGLTPASCRPHDGLTARARRNSASYKRHALAAARRAAESVERRPGGTVWGRAPNPLSRSRGSHAGRRRLTTARNRGWPGPVDPRRLRQPLAAAAGAERWAGKKRRMNNLGPLSIAVLIAGLCSCPPAIAADAGLCPEASTTLAIRKCLDEEFKKAEATLESYVAEALRLRAKNEKMQAAISSAQEAWLKYRDNQCKADGLVFEGGTMQPVAHLMCFVTKTRRRSCEVWDSFIRQLVTEVEAPPEEYCK